MEGLKPEELEEPEESSEGKQVITVKGAPIVKDFAEMIGTYRETTTQTLNQFKQQGWIDIQRKHIQVLDPPALEEISVTT